MSPKALRVAFLGHSAELSGAELSLVELAGAFEDVQPVVLLAEDGPLVERLEQADVEVEVLPLRRGARLVRRDQLRGGSVGLLAAGTATAAYAARLARRLRSLRVDLVHANTLKALFYGGAATRLARKPMVWHVHDRISDDYLPRRGVGLVRRVARSTAHGVIANSRATLATLEGLRVPVAVIPEPVRHQAFGARTARNCGPFVAAMVGRIASWKGQDVFLRAFAEAFPEGAERAVIIGAPLFGEEEYERSIRALVDRLGLWERVELRGFSEDVAAELTEVDALVHASVIPEPFGRVIVEGMAAGLPVIAAGAGGPDEIVTDGIDGLLYPPGDAGSLAARLRRVATDPALAARLGAAGVERARAFSPELAATETSAFYQRVLEAAA